MTTSRESIRVLQSSERHHEPKSARGRCKRNILGQWWRNPFVWVNRGKWRCNFLWRRPACDTGWLLLSYSSPLLATEKVLNLVRWCFWINRYCRCLIDAKVGDYIEWQVTSNGENVNYQSMNLDCNGSVARLFPALVVVIPLSELGSISFDAVGSCDKRRTKYSFPFKNPVILRIGLFLDGPLLDMMIVKRELVTYGCLLFKLQCKFYQYSHIHKTGFTEP